MKVRSSTRATSLGSVRAQNEFGFLAASSRVSAPGLDELARQPIPLVVRSVAPHHPIGLGELGDLGDPIKEATVRGRGIKRFGGHQRCDPFQVVPTTRSA